MKVDFKRPRSGAASGYAPLPQVEPRESLRLRLYGLLVTLDCVAIVVGFVIASLIRYGALSTTDVRGMCALLMPVYLAAALNKRAYGLAALKTPRGGAFRALMAFAFAVGIILLISFYFKSSGNFSRLAFAIGTVMSAVLIFGARAALGIWVKDRFGDRLLAEILITDGCARPPAPGMLVVDAAAYNLSPDPTDPVMLDRLGQLLRNVDRVVIACQPARRRDWALSLKGANIQGEVVAADLNDVGVLGTARFGGDLTLLVSVGPLLLHERLLKRLFDIAFAGVSLLLLSPVMLAAALAIKLESRGPTFFIQRRLGYGNCMFSIYKFRSMRSELCDVQGTRSTTRDDPRLTRVGRLIRRVSIDELPQLFNVLGGSMSIVGPRPHALGSLAGEQLFWEIDQRYSHRHATKPGLTGLAQVRGFRGATHDVEALINRLQADLEYQAGWTIWRDISIILSTVRVLFHRNAF